MTTTSLELKPLSARSVVLSLLLGAHPHRMSPAEITRAGEHFGVPVATLRVALTRAVAAGDLHRLEGDYVLGPRLAARQRRQDEGVEDAAAPWDGGWEMAVVVATGRSASQRAALREALAVARLAELREGVWTRPANLRRTPGYAEDPVLSCFTATPADDSTDLAASLWDLDIWASTGWDLLALMADVTDRAARLAVAARIVRHLTTDPLLPTALLPHDWPGAQLRTAYTDYQAELRALTLVS